LAKKYKNARRHFVQALYVALTNGYAAGFAGGRIYTGPLKAYCVPGLNCYSCPGALFACPVGALQAALSGRGASFPFYVTGFLLAFGALMGRLICGFLCPFGLVQDLLYKIPFFKKYTRLKGERVLNKLRYVILIVFVLLLPMLAVDVVGQGLPWFCKYICPSGTLFGGIPLLGANDVLRDVAGALFAWKLALLILLLLLSLMVYRPFCRYVCPLGAIYGLCNPIALYRYRVDQSACTGCKTCQRACPMHIPVYRTPNSTACIRCGICKNACPRGAIGSTLQRKGQVCAQGDAIK
jgi:polyferredoxin